MKITLEAVDDHVSWWLFHNKSTFQLRTPCQWAAFTTSNSHGYLIFFYYANDKIGREKKSESAADVKCESTNRVADVLKEWQRHEIEIHWRIAYVDRFGMFDALCNTRDETMGAVVRRTELPPSSKYNSRLFIYLFFSQKSNHMLIYSFCYWLLYTSWISESISIFIDLLVLVKPNRLWFYRAAN